MAPVQTSVREQWGQRRAPFISKDRFVSEEFLRQEQERLWPRVWQIACRLEEIPNPGDWVEYEIMDDSILVVRVDEHSVKAHFNSCRHRGTKLGRGCGSADHLRCPFHGWSWNLDGTIREVVDPEDFPGIADANVDLAECRIDTWGGFVFVNMDPAAPPLLDYLAPLTDVRHLGAYHLEDMRYQSHRTIKLNVNWKTALDAFTESYHVPGTHPQALQRLPYEDTVIELLGDHSRAFTPVGIGPSRRWPGPPDTPLEILRALVEVLVPLELATPDDLAFVDTLSNADLDGVSPNAVLARIRRDRLGAWSDGLSDEQLNDIGNFLIFPNFNFNIFPGLLFGYRSRPNGHDPHSCIFEVISLQLYPEGREPPYNPQFIEDPLAYDSWGLALHQDIENLTFNVQQGMRNRSFRGLRLSSYQESRVWHMHERIDHYLEH